VSSEKPILIETVRIPQYRESYGNLSDLGRSIADDGLRHPIAVWSDGTLISGERRLRCHFLLSGAPGGSQFRWIPAVFVSTLEDAAKRLLADNGDELHAMAMKPTEMLKLWEVLRRLDGPAAARRADAARRRGVELRRQTVAGQRKPGRNRSRTEDYALAVMAEPFGLSEVTASRLSTVHALANAEGVDPQRREQARRALLDIDAGNSSIWANYQRLITGRTAPPSRPRAVAPAVAAAAARQRAAWERTLPQMEGLVAGLAELGPPNTELTWEQVGPVHARLAAVRRELEKMIKQMKGHSQS
jgi:hypothetical protein